MLEGGGGGVRWRDRGRGGGEGGGRGGGGGSPYMVDVKCKTSAPDKQQGAGRT
jgi:hypothetical protein